MRAKLGGWLLKPTLLSTREQMRRYNGAFFLGSKVVKDHGSTANPVYGLEKGRN